MKIKNEKGVTLIALVIIVIVLGILGTITAQEFGNILDEVNKENASTNMLLIQAKAKVLNEKAGFSKDDSILKGQKLSDITGNEKIENLKNLGVINPSEKNYDNYYVWDKQTITDLEIGIEKMNSDEFYIVNYSTEEVIYSEGYKHTDGKTYYKLSEISALE